MPMRQMIEGAGYRVEDVADPRSDVSLNDALHKFEAMRKAEPIIGKAPTVDPRTAIVHGDVQPQG